MIDLGGFASSGVFKKKVQILTSQNWTVPAGVYKIAIEATGGGGAGNGTNNGSGLTVGGAGGNASPTIKTWLDVRPADVLTIVIGAGGAGVDNGTGGNGGNTTVAIGNRPILNCTGGAGAFGQSPSATVTPYAASNGATEIRGGAGGSGAISAAGTSGQRPLLAVPSNPASFGGIISSTPISTGGTAGSNYGAGGGGGSSVYGAGGNGADGSNTSTPNAGQDAPATSYGAGGGGASGGGTPTQAGGNGANGIVEIWY